VGQKKKVRYEKRLSVLARQFGRDWGGKSDHSVWSKEQSGVAQGYDPKKACVGSNWALIWLLVGRSALQGEENSRSRAPGIAHKREDERKADEVGKLRPAITEQTLLGGGNARQKDQKQ